ncbi:MAG: PAS domain S-box protein, partial [Desulfobacterales bacterium]|nr:PAS domain S-box protein [Desulfobacterales bacterium]
QTVSGTVATTGRAVVDLDVSKHGDYPAGVLGELNAVTFACVPLIGQEAIIGTLAIADREERPDILDAADLLQVLAGSLAQEIERHQREDAYRLLVETPNTGIIRFDTQGRYLAVNQYVANVLGGRPTEFVGKSLRDVVPDKADLYLERFARIVAEKKGARYEDPFRLPGGTRWFSADLQPVIGPTGDVTGIQVVTLDVTEHKQAYLERESTIRMLEILNASTDLRDLMRSLVYFMQEMSGCKAVGIRLRDGDDFPYYETNGFADDFVAAETHLCVADLDGQVLRDEVGNPVLECMCGNILCGRFDPALPFFTEFGSFVSNGTSQLLARTTEAERQARTRNRCNAEGYESVCLVPLRSGDETFGLLQFNDRREDRFSPQFVAQTERLAGNVAIALSQRKAEETLRKREEQYRAVADNIGDYIMRYDKEGHHIYANRAAIDITGLPVKEYLGKTHREMGFPEQLCALWEKHIRLVFDTGEQQNIAFDVELATGVVSLELQLNPEFSSNGRIESVIGISRDITARKKMEARLQQAQKMESIGDLAGGIAHDFNNILFPIVGMSELLLEDLPPDSIEHQNATEILKAGNRGSDLVKQILAFSRQTEHRMMPIRVQQILKEVYRLVRATIPTNIKIDKNIQADCGLVNADPTQVHQVAMNLITNAYHAVETNTGEIQVALAETELSQDDVSPGALLPGRYALLTVTDTGAGIDPGMMGKIFEPYFTTKGKGKGTGLGLAVVYGIVKEHHGDIVVSSEPGKGTTFSVYLPIIHDIENVAGSEEIALAESEGERILLVDDEVPVAKLEQQMLERLGYRVTSRVSSLEALEAFRENPDAYDMVVTDMAMPNMTGDQFAREVKTIRPEIPILICTGFSERINQVEAEAIGVAGFLMKPIIKSDLAKMVREVLDGVKNH